MTWQVYYRGLELAQVCEVVDLHAEAASTDTARRHREMPCDVVERTVMRMQNMRLASALDAWCLTGQEQRRLRVVAQRACQRLAPLLSKAPVSLQPCP